MPTTSQPPSPEPLRATLSDADDRIRLNHWMPPQQGIFPRIRMGSRWFNTLWALPIGAAALLCLIALAQSLRELPSVAAFIQSHPGIAQSAPSVELGFPVVAAAPAFPEYVLHAVHHACRAPNPGRSPTPLLGTRLHTGERLVPVSGARAEGSHLDRERRFRHAADMARYSRSAPYARSIALVAFLGQSVVADQRRRLLCVALFDGSVAQARSADLGGPSSGALDGDPIRLAELSGRRRLDPLQRPPAAQLLHHGIRRGARFDLSPA